MPVDALAGTTMNSLYLPFERLQLCQTVNAMPYEQLKVLFQRLSSYNQLLFSAFHF